MFKELKRYTLDYTLLFGIVIGLLVLFYVFRSDNLAQQIISVVTGILYFGWGLFHHSRIKHFTEKIVLEYFFVSLFASSILILLTL